MCETLYIIRSKIPPVGRNHNRIELTEIGQSLQGNLVSARLDCIFHTIRHAPLTAVVTKHALQNHNLHRKLNNLPDKACLVQ